MNQAKIIVKNLTQTCLAAPSSWEGRLGSKGFVYIKYRWGVLRVYRTAREEETIEKRSQIFEKRLGGRFDGCMETKEMKTKLAGLFRFQGRTKMHEDWHSLMRTRKTKRKPADIATTRLRQKTRRSIERGLADAKAGRLVSTLEDFLNYLPKKERLAAKADEALMVAYKRVVKRHGKTFEKLARIKNGLGKGL